MRPSVAFAADGLSTPIRDLAADVRDGLASTPKTIPARWLYDAVGSALFEAICLLPWYRITRGETAMLERIGPEIARLRPQLREVIELGPGSGEKLSRLLAPLARPPIAMTAHLVDVSEAALDAAQRTLAQVPGVRVVRHHATFEEGLRAAAAGPRTGARLVAFLGSNIGNFDPGPAAALLTAIAEALGPGDALLLGTDLVKPERTLQEAYDDPLGVTAAFNRNVLARVNRELGADFELGAFRHEARWNPRESRMEMHLVSTRAQRVHVPGAGVTATFEAGESIWTESSYKYEPEQIVAMGREAGLHSRAQWIDPDARFALTLFTR